MEEVAQREITKKKPTGVHLGKVFEQESVLAVTIIMLLVKSSKISGKK